MRELVVVMPVYNEEECIVEVVQSWQSELTKLNIDAEIIVINDGSSDGTKDKLSRFENNSRVTVINKQNSGHGPTILKGYRLAVDQAVFVFQIDSDNEMSPDYFYEFWNQRDRYNAVFAVRKDREQNIGRRIISVVSRVTVRFLFGKGVVDVNVPYRLIKSSVLKGIIGKIPDNTFAPNVIISGALGRLKEPVLNIAVPHENRKTGSVSIVKWKLWKSASLAFLQTLNAVWGISK